MYRTFYRIFIVLFFLEPGNKINNKEAIAAPTESNINHRPVPNRQYFAAIPIEIALHVFYCLKKGLI
jgi:hypothetical protein